MPTDGGGGGGGSSRTSRRSWFPALSVLPVRDTVAFAAMLTALPHFLATPNLLPSELVRLCYQLADEFAAQSQGHWPSNEGKRKT